jgi:hypothetical protein
VTKAKKSAQIYLDHQQRPKTRITAIISTIERSKLKHYAANMKPFRGDKKLSGSIFVTVSLMTAVLAVVASSLPLIISADSSNPPLLLLAAFGLSVVFGMCIILVLALRSGLGLSQTTVVTVIIFNVAIVLIKFVLAPLGLYASNASNPFATPPLLVGIDNSSVGFAFAAIGSGLAYIIALTVIYKILIRRSQSVSPARKRHYRTAILLIGGLVLMAVLGVWYVFIPLLVVGLPAAALGDYLSKLGPALPAIILALVLATVFAVLAFRSANADAKRLGQPATIAGLFWLCLCLIFMYHVLWVVFMTALVTIWPFKTFIPNSK